MKQAAMHSYQFAKSSTLGRTWTLAAIVLLAISPITAKADVKAGAETYKTNCEACHGADGSSDTVVGKALGSADLRSVDVQKIATPQLAKLVEDGKDKMPPFKSKLNAAQIKDVIDYVRTLAAKPKK